MVMRLSVPAGVIHNSLLVVAEEDLNWEPTVTANLEAVWEAAQSLHVLVLELKVELEVLLNSGLGDGLWNDRSTALETPDEAAKLLAIVDVFKQGKTYRT